MRSSVVLFVLAVLVLAVVPSCASVNYERLLDELVPHVARCADASDDYELQLEVRHGRVVRVGGEPFSRGELACLRWSLRTWRPSGITHSDLRVRRHAAPDAPAVHAFIDSRRDDVLACRPCVTTFVTATADHPGAFELAVELEDHEADLNLAERVCLLSALGGFPDATAARSQTVIHRVAPPEGSCSPHAIEDGASE